MASQPVSRPMTFTGCWTCKARKVRCDERPVHCRNCEKKGVKCEGYGIRLQWITDEFSHAASSQGRRSLPLDRTTPVYRSGILDQFLSDIEQHDGSGRSSGPFSVFPVESRGNPQKRSASSCENWPNAMTISASRHEWRAVPGSFSDPFMEDYRLMQPIHLSYTGDTQIDALMIHYNTHVAEVLQPIGHARNPYRSIYLSTALEGMAYHQSGVETSGAKAYLALAQSLTASSAFHLWNHDKRQGRYRVLGLRHRFLAMQSLQEAVQGAVLTDHYGALMTAVLSLITIGVMSGEGDDFRAHIDAAAQLRDMCGQPERLDGASRQLNEIGAFLSLLARTLTFRKSQAPPPGYGSDQTSAEEDIIRSSTCYEYVYGITPTIATAISQTCLLAENLAHFRADQEVDPLPEDFVEACEKLGHQLHAWRFELETNTSIFLGDGVLYSILTHTAKAWHGAALVYYLIRVRGARAAGLVRQIDDIAEQLHAAEDMKWRLDREQHRRSMSPITWPGFVGACSAVPCRRATWRRWWEGIQRYGIASNEKQWQVVQQVWERMDSEEREGKGPIDWTEAFVSLGIQMLPS